MKIPTGHQVPAMPRMKDPDLGPLELDRTKHFPLLVAQWRLDLAEDPEDADLVLSPFTLDNKRITWRAAYQNRVCWRCATAQPNPPVPAKDDPGFLHAVALTEWRAECADAARLEFLNGIDSVMARSDLPAAARLALEQVKGRADAAWCTRKAPPWSDDSQTGWSTANESTTEHCAFGAPAGALF